MAWIYLDNNATTQPAPEVVAVVREMHETLWANPSSVHRFGQAVRQRVELARAGVAGLIGCRDRELVFTSGGTESNNMALRGILAAAPASASSAAAGSAAPRRLLMTTRIEHSAIREPGEFLERCGVTRVHLPIDRDGLIAPASLAAALQQHAEPETLTLVSVQWANNETGVVQPIAELAAVIRAHRVARPTARVVFHSDATQAVGKIPVDVKQAGVDLLSFSGHKFHGPKGVGGLFIRVGIRPAAQNLGGPQERDRRGGTENTAGIVGMGVAAELVRPFLEDAVAIERLTALRDRFERAILAAAAGAVVNSGGGAWSNGKAPPRLWNTSDIAFPRLEAEALLIGMSERGLCTSAGAACSSGSLEPSPVLLAMGIPPELAHGSVRFSLSRNTTAEEIEQAIAIVPAVVERLGRTMPMGAER